ncbi:hypothetical protein B0H17DRAFT_1334576 [Mycena rosella]|uniref:Uncharacterized protein n=1 Tax=Mycena rosella TaxID=1033263 RepID=A0AAD7D2J6_MYCRO|nr:hypothetical protein B0H17DRAFT_1334576 [Mycena rosella]
MSTSKKLQQAARATLRTVHSSPATRAATVPDAPLNLPPIFDIFDVPVGLRASGAFAREHAKPRTSSSCSPSLSRPMPPRAPQTLVFEGPACRRPVVRSPHDLPPPTYAPSHVVTMFDGPAHSGGRFQRRSHSERKSNPPSRTKVQLAMGAVAATAVAVGVVHS